MSSAKLNDVKRVLKSGARANKYKILLAGKGGPDVDILCKATNFPSATIGQIEVFNQGRKLVIPGDTTYTTTWTTTFFSTEDHKLRKDMITWMKEFDDFKENTHASAPAFLDFEIYQMNADGSQGTGYKFFNVWPQEIGEMAVADDSADTLLEFDTTFSFTHWEFI